MAQKTKNNYVETFISNNKKDEGKDLQKLAEATQKSLAKELRISLLQTQSHVEAAQNEVDALETKLGASLYSPNVKLASIVSLDQELETRKENLATCLAAKDRLYTIADTIGIDIERTI